jgi:hypothetical protein
LSTPRHAESNVTDGGRWAAILHGMMQMAPDTDLIACVGAPWCPLQCDAAQFAQENNCAMCERWRFCGQSRQIVRLPNNGVCDA